MVETIPTLTYGTVTGRFLAAVADSTDDVDTHPDGVPLSGTVIFTPSAKAILIPGVGTVLPAAIEATLDADGYISLNGERGIELVASDSPAVNPNGFTYAVSFKNLRYGTNNSVTYQGFNIAVAGGTTTDLTEFAPVPASGGVPIVRGPEGPQGPPGAPGVGTVASVAGRTGEVTLTKSDVGLASVNNTADADKPVSTAQAEAIGVKYTKPSTGVPLGDLASGVQVSLGRADTALQSAPVTSVAGRNGAITLSKADVGLTNVDNTADSAKPVSSAQAAALASKADLVSGVVPYAQLPVIDKSTVGLGNVDNTSDANKPVSTAQASAIGAKYTKPASGIPSTDFTTAVQTSLGKADSALQSAPVTSVAGRTGAVTLTKSDVGLANVDNTADTAKPVSTAQATAIAAKVTNGGSVATIMQITSAAYAALATKDANTLYVVVG